MCPEGHVQECSQQPNSQPQTRNYPDVHQPGMDKQTMAITLIKYYTAMKKNKLLITQQLA